MPTAKPNINDDNYWTYVSDIMTGMTIIFLFIAINYIKLASEMAETVKDIVVDYKRIKEIYEQMVKEEFSEDFEDWDAEFNAQDMSFQFNSSEVLFKKGEAELSENFKNILDDFIPRYIFIIKNEAFTGQITAIQIEGHTSSDWGEGKQRGLDAYLKNMELSQNRSANVLNYILNIDDIGESDIWTRNKLSAVGYSSSKILYDVNGQVRSENELTSRRVSFKLIMDTESQLNRIRNLDSNRI
tara:strand:- start:285 stop:1010 length:726 start_codon:yes stop_codon:yes gene_type:complete